MPTAFHSQPEADTDMLLRNLIATLLLSAPLAALAAPTVTLVTNKGDIEIELAADKAPKSAENFLSYARSGFYNGTVFHRVIDGFMIQGGGFTIAEGELTQKATRAPVINEADNGLKNLTGTVAMARTNQPHSATSQFFINVADNDFLNHSGKNPRGWGYAVFGKVTRGMNVVQQIAKTRTGQVGPYENVPFEPVIIKKTVIKP